jgi:uncharacterized protein YbjQ (UPF0145 family)
MTDTSTIEGESQQLAELRDHLFTSDLSVDEFVLLRQTGFSAKGMVVGSSIYHIGLQMAKWSQSQELETLSKAMHEARELAISRMLQEAAAIDADGVVGVDLTLQMYVGGQDVLEFVAIGTAISYDQAPKSLRLSNGAPFSSHLSGQSFVKLWKSGFVPTHFSFGVCVFHVAHQGIRQSMRQVGQNVEMELYTQAIYSAREMAMERLQVEAKTWGASGIIGTEMRVNNHVWGEHAVEFMALGTAVREHGLEVSPLAPPTTVMGMND